jgi:hypothetical protein
MYLKVRLEPEYLIDEDGNYIFFEAEYEPGKPTAQIAGLRVEGFGVLPVDDDFIRRFRRLESMVVKAQFAIEVGERDSALEAIEAIEKDYRDGDRAISVGNVLRELVRSAGLEE